MGRWVGGPEVMLEGRDERLELGLPSSSWRSEEEDEDVADPRLLRWEMRAFLGAKGSMKSKSGWRFWGDVGTLSLGELLDGRVSVGRPNLRARIRSTWVFSSSE